MTETAAALQNRAIELRAAFDRSFAVAMRGEAEAKHDMIAIRVGAEPFAIRLGEIAGLFVDRKVVPVPGGGPMQLGIAGFRGALLPVFSLPAFFAPAAERGPRWLVVAAAAPVALAFDAFEGHLRLPAGAILPRQAAAPSHSVAPHFVRTGELVRPLIHLPSVIDALGAAEAQKSEPAQE